MMDSCFRQVMFVLVGNKTFIGHIRLIYETWNFQSRDQKGCPSMEFPN